MIFSIPSTAPKSFGILGGGGRSGNSTVGRDGSSGSSGSSKLGSVGSAGSVNPAVGTSGRASFGRVGRTIGLIFISKSGMYTVNPALTLCKSKIISGHLGN